MPSPNEFDLIVIGNGSAGDNIARTLGRRGMRVAIIEAKHLGGECLNDGCVPSKALIHLAKAPRSSSWSEVVASIEATQALVRGNDPNGGFEKDGVTLFWGEAVFRSPREIEVNGEVLTARDVVVATGTAPGIPPIPGLAEVQPLTNRNVFTMASLPRRLAVIGGGPIGLELGQALGRLGSTVTIYEAADRIASTEEPEVSAEIARILAEEGVRIHAGTAITAVHGSPEGPVEIETAGGRDAFDNVLVAAGRMAQIPPGLVDLGLELDKRGYIAITQCGRTNLPGLWAAGDVTGKFAFTHYASYQAHHIARHIQEDSCDPIPDAIVPWAIFTDPEIGNAGMTEQQARDAGHRVKTGFLEAAELDWFRTTAATAGFAKVIADADSGVLLGAHFICDRASTLVGEACLAIQHGLTARQVAGTIHPYPTASELFRWACAKAV
jgi:probable pyridine nucleotide-disulfide oxidoreductase